MPRVRAILIDNTTGRLFSGVQKVQDAKADNVIGGKVPQTRIVTNSGTIVTLKKAAQIGITTAGAFVTNISVTLGTSPSLSGLVLTFKVGDVYETAATVASVTVAMGSKVASAGTAFSVPGNQWVFLDVAYVTTSGRGASKLQTTFTYFPVAL